MEPNPGHCINAILLQRDLQNRFAVLYETTTHKISSLNQSLPKMVDHQTKRLVQLVHSLKDEMVDIGLK